MRSILLAMLIATLIPIKNTYASDIEAYFILDHVENTNGGIEESGETLIDIGLTYTKETNFFSSNKGGEFFAYLLANGGGDPSLNIGDSQVTSNIETNDTAKIYELWYKQALSATDHITFGLHDYNSVFYGLESSGLLINSSFGIGPEVAQVGPSIFSTTSLGLVYTSERKRGYTYASIYDGIPGDPEREKGTHIKFDSGDGVFLSIENGWFLNDDKDMKLAIGFWHHSAKIESSVTGELIDDNFGIYSIGEMALLKNTSAFYQLGYASSSRNQVAQYVGIGAIKKNLLSSRGEGSIGVATAILSDEYKDVNPSLKSYETAIEVTYRYTLNEYFAIQPDIQYIVNPGFDPELENAIVISLRFESTLSI